MSVTFTADVWCDVEECNNWEHAVTSTDPIRKRDVIKHFTPYKRVKGKDYCRFHAKQLFPELFKKES